MSHSPSQNKKRIQAWHAYLAAASLLVLFHLLLPQGGLEQSLLYQGLGASAVIAILFAVWLHRPARRAPWFLIAAGQASFVAGDLLWLVYEQIGETPFPSWADAFYLGGYPFMAAGLTLLIRSRLGGGDRGGLLDAAILTTGAGVLSWTILMQPSLRSSELTSLELAISAAYPIADLLLIGAAIGLFTTPGARTPSFRFISASLLALLVSDQVYALQNLEGSYMAGGLLDVGWLISYLAIGASALHPSMRTLSVPHPVPVTWVGQVRLVFLAAAMLTGPGLMTVGRSDSDLGMWVVAGGSALLSLLVLARLAGLVGVLAHDVEQRRALEEQLSSQALHDPLTALANRRLFVDRAAAALRASGADGRVAAMFLDLDDFKTVNDSLGHAAGDELLVAVAGRIHGCLRVTDLAARLGGDEFGILLEGVPDITVVTRVAERILASLEAPVTVVGTPITVGASIGIAFAAPGRADVIELLRDADIAMYQAKAGGKARYQVYADIVEAEGPDRVSASAPALRASERRFGLEAG